MDEDIYGLSADDVNRLRRLLEAHEGGARLRQADTIRRIQPTADVEVYLAYTTGTISALSTSNGITTLNGNINSSVTTITANSVAGFPLDRYFAVTIDTEQFLVTFVETVSKNLTVVRGYNGSTAASHTNGANITLTIVTLGTGPAIVSKAILDSNGDYDLDETDQVPINLYNIATSTIPSGYRGRVLRDPFSGIYTCNGVEGGSGGGISSPLTTKGDIWGFSTVDARIPIGTDGYVLSADSTQALGVKWIAVAGTGTVTSVNGSGGTTGLTVTGGPITGSGTLTLGGTLIVANGGTGATTLTAHGVLLGQGGSPVSAMAALAKGSLIIGQTSADPAPLTVGANGLALVADSTQSLGVKWAAVGSVASINASGGTTGLSFSGGPISFSGTLTLSGTLVVGNGGTGTTSLTNHGLLIGQGASPVAAMSALKKGSLVTSQGTGSDPVELLAGTNGYILSADNTQTAGIKWLQTLVVANGGTGAITLTNHGLLIGQGTSPVAAMAALAKGSLVTSTGATSDPTALAVGTDGYVLYSDSTQATGLRWGKTCCAATLINNGSSPYSAKCGDDLLVDTSAGNVSIVLPNPASCCVQIEKISTDANYIVLTTASGLINGAAEYSFNTPYQMVNSCSNGSNWFIGVTPPNSGTTQTFTGGTGGVFDLTAAIAAGVTLVHFRIWASGGVGDSSGGGGGGGAYAEGDLIIANLGGTSVTVGTGIVSWNGGFSSIAPGGGSSSSGGTGGAGGTGTTVTDPTSAIANYFWTPGGAGFAGATGGGGAAGNAYGPGANGTNGAGGVGAYGAGSGGAPTFAGGSPGGGAGGNNLLNYGTATTILSYGSALSTANGGIGTDASGWQSGSVPMADGAGNFRPIKATRSQFVSISAGNGTLLAGNMEGAQDCTLASSGATAMTTRTAAQIIANVPGFQIGSSYRLRVYNTNGGTLTLTGGTGVTIAGTATIATIKFRDYYVTMTGAATITMQNLGSGVAD